MKRKKIQIRTERECLSSSIKGVCSRRVRFGSFAASPSSNSGDETEFGSGGGSTMVEVVSFGLCHVTEFDSGDENGGNSRVDGVAFVFSARG